jgi:antitoxin ParD1/3/4
MPTRNVVLTQENQTMIESLVQSGRYQNASEVLRDGLRLVERREAEEEAKLIALRQAAGIGITALENGNSLHFSSALDLRTHLQKVGAKAILNAQT